MKKIETKIQKIKKSNKKNDIKCEKMRKNPKHLRTIGNQKKSDLIKCQKFKVSGTKGSINLLIHLMVEVLILLLDIYVVVSLILM